MYCLGCGYSLSGINSRKCPECGKTFSSTDRSTYSLHPRHADNAKFVRCMAVLAGLAIGACASSIALDVSASSKDPIYSIATSGVIYTAVAFILAPVGFSFISILCPAGTAMLFSWYAIHITKEIVCGHPLRGCMAVVFVHAGNFAAGMFLYNAIFRP